MSTFIDPKKICVNIFFNCLDAYKQINNFIHESLKNSDQMTQNKG